MRHGQKISMTAWTVLLWAASQAGAQSPTSSAHSLASPLEGTRAFIRLESAVAQLAGDVPLSDVDAWPQTRRDALSCKEKVYLQMMRIAAARQAQRVKLLEHLEVLFELQGDGQSSDAVRQSLRESAAQGRPADPRLVAYGTRLVQTSAAQNAATQALQDAEVAMEVVGECLPPGDHNIRTSELSSDLRRVQRGALVARDFMRTLDREVKALGDKPRPFGTPNTRNGRTLAIVGVVPPRTAPTADIPICVEDGGRILAVYRFDASGLLAAIVPEPEPASAAVAGSACDRFALRLLSGNR